MIKYFDQKEKSFCGLYEIYKLNQNKDEFIEDLKFFINFKEPGYLSNLPFINESPVLNKRYKEKNDELFSIVRLLKTNSEE